MSEPRSRTESRRPPFPIPEARALKRTELFPETHKALWELLDDLRAAVDTSGARPKHEMLSTSFLVSGDRGSGKTTIFLTAAAAMEDVGEYALDGGAHDASWLRELASRVAWLDTLDLEPVPRRANLLAAVLVRIRDALEKATGRSIGRESSESVMGGHIEKTWERLDRLVQEATFMWEETSHMNDPRRERAQQQIKAAEIFATFPRRFSEALDRVAATLSRFTPRHEPVLVLPIDNVDRSIEHIYSIVKLCRLASSPRLWFVLAAARPDFQLFLERSFQQELASSGRPGADDHDDDRSIARRQASTTMRRALPRGHQIEIEPVTLETAWSTESDDYASLEHLLGEVELPAAASSSRGTLIQLFDLGSRIDETVRRAYGEALRATWCEGGLQREPKGSLLTHAARMALLNLSPRALRDLKRSIHTAREAREVGREKGSQDVSGKVAAQTERRVGCEEAVPILVDQLRSAIDESILPFWASEQLHNRILREDMHGNRVLDLRGSPVQQLKQTHLSQVLGFEPERWADARPRCVVFSDVHLRKFDDIVLELHDLDRPGQRVPLPADVAGWFMLLHDLLRTFPAPRVISGGVTAHDPVLSPELIVTRHELSVNGEQVWLEFGWTLPEWDTFLDFSIFTIQWRAFLHHMEQVLRGKFEHAELLRLVRAAWIEDVCSICDEGHGQWDWGALSEAVRGDGAPGIADHEKVAAAIVSYEKCVGLRVRRLVKRCSEAEAGAGGKPVQPIEQRRLTVTREWFRRSLPALLHVEQSVGVGQEILDDAELHGSGVTLQRRQLVRDAGMRSTAYRSLMERRRGKGGEGWLRSVSSAWSGPAERRHGDRRWDGRERRTGEVIRPDGEGWSSKEHH